MEKFQLIFGIVVLILVGFAFYRNIFVFLGVISVSKFEFDSIKPLFKKIKKGQIPDDSLLLKYCSDYKTRELTFQLLKKYNKSDLFLKEFYTLEKAAKSNLSGSLDFPGDLEQSPDEIIHVKKIIIDQDDNQLMYHTFKFKVYEPHWAAKHNWMLGVVGPYFDNSKPFDLPIATHSRLSKSIKTTPKEEVLWVHRNIYLGKKASTQHRV